MMIDGFRLEERVHQGSMAAIWRVTGSDATTPLAMKIPVLRGGDDPIAVVGFEVEQTVLPTLSGVHVPRFVAASDLPERPYLVMEFLGGRSLRARLADVPLPPGEVASLGARVAAALHDLHRQDVIHLDVKPSNVMFRESGEAVLIDFGLSRHDRLPDLLAAQFHLPMGTGPYISPEQVLNVRNEPRSDLFALGVVLYFLATGKRPFGNPTTVTGLRRRLYRDPVPPRALSADFPPWLQEVILRCLEVEAGERHDTAEELAFQLLHPAQVVLTARAQRTAQDRFVTRAKKWLAVRGTDSRQSVAGRIASAPVVVVAVDLDQSSEALTKALRLTIRRILQSEPDARLTCVTVIKTARIAIDSNIDLDGPSVRAKRLASLKDWARPIGIAADKITCHALEASDPGAAIIEFSRSNGVHQIVIGSRGSSTLRRYLGSVSSQVVAQAACTVTVVKAAEHANAPSAEG